MHANNSIHWLPVRDIPRTPGTQITVKDEQGDLHNVCVGRNGQIPFAAHELRGFILNTQVR